MNKAIVRNDLSSPIWGLSNMQRELDTLFNGLFKHGDQQQAFNFAPTCDIEETATHFKVAFDIPGVKKENIHLEVQDNLLSVSGEKNEERITNEAKRHVTERFSGQFRRVVTLPTQVASDKVEATYKDGVLHVTVPKAENAKGKKISIA